MQVVQFSCPNCHGAFTLKTPNASAILGKSFCCPKCHYSTPFSSLLKIQQSTPAPFKTHIANGGGATMPLKTRIATGGTGNCNLSLVVESTGRRFPLMPGVHILGRDSSDSRATLKLAPDPYMSRQQARLVIEMRGAQPLCQIYALSATNACFVNNQKISSGQAVTLKVGDKILLGTTIVQLVPTKRPFDT